MVDIRPFEPTRAHLARLRTIWRSAGWPAQDALELDLLAAKLITISIAKTGHQTLCLTDAGIKQLVQARERGRRASSAHDRFAHQYLIGSGRIVWRELSFRAQFINADAPEQASRKSSNPMLPLAPECLAHAPQQNVVQKYCWRVARPDVFSVRNTSVEDYLHPMVHEVKVNRSDLLADLRNTAKRESYQWLCCECFYAFPKGVAEPEEIPQEFGVWLLHGTLEDGEFELLRPARHSPCKLPFGVWFSLAKAAPMVGETEVPHGLS